MKLSKWCALLFVLSLLFMSTAIAESSKTVYVQELKNIEESDDFPLRIIDKQIVRDAVIDINGNDLLQLTIQNNSGSDTQSISLYLMAYDENEEQYRLSISFTLGRQPESYGGDISIMKGGLKTISISCRADDFVGVRAIISSYTDKEGITHDNPNADKWYDVACYGETKEIRSFD